MVEELTITNVEETPLSQGETLESLRQKLIRNKNLYNSLKSFHYFLIGTAGVCSIFAGAVLQDGVAIQDKLGVFLSCTISLSILNIGGLAAIMPREYDWKINGYRERYVNSFDSYVNELGEIPSDNKDLIKISKQVKKLRKKIERHNKKIG